MSELEPRLREAAEATRPDWSDERASAVLGGLDRRRRQRARRRRRVALGAVTLAAAGLAVAVWLAGRGAPGQAPHGEPVPSVVQAPTEPELLEVPEVGLRAEPIDRNTQLVVAERDEEHAVLRLMRGTGRFDVEPSEGRRRVVRVLAGPLEVEVVGTRFTVTVEDERAGVMVERGRVHVRWPGGETVLEPASGWLWVPTVGEGSAVTPPAGVDLAVAPEAAERGGGMGTGDGVRVERADGGGSGEAANGGEVASTHVARVVEVSHPTERGAVPSEAPVELDEPTADWVALAESGQYAEAASRLESGSEPADSVHELLLAADAARLGGRPDLAVPWLERVLSEHRDDARASLAAFTLGRLLLEQLGRPGEAAAEFARARELAPSGPLAEDALAREVEAWSLAGRPDRARTAADEYLERYPGGRREDAVRRWGLGPGE